MLPFICSVIDHRLCVKNKKVAHEPVDECVSCSCHILTSSEFMNRCMETWNLFVLNNKEVKKLTVTSFMHLSSSRSQIAMNQNDCRLIFNL